MSLRVWLGLAALASWASVSAAQAPPGPPVPVLSVPPPPAPLPAPSPAPPGSLGLLDGPQFFPQSGPPLSQGAPLLPPPASLAFIQPPGWFIALEAAATLPRVGPNFLLDGGHYYNNLDWTVAPRGTLGYCFENGGALLFSYRSLASQANTGDDSIGLGQRTRLDANWFDLTYLSRPYGVWEGLRVRWEGGMRGAYLFSDVNSQWAGGEIDREHRTFAGAGPHAGVRLSWWFRNSGLSLFTRFDLGLLAGQTDARRDSFSGDPSVGPLLGDAQRTSHWVLDTRFEAGLGYVVPTQRWLRFDVGYQAEAFTWQYLTLSDGGPFVRCTLGF